MPPGRASSPGYAAAVDAASVRWFPPVAARWSIVASVGVLAACWSAGAVVGRLGSRPGIALDAALTDALAPLQRIPPVEVAAQVLAVVGEQPVSVVVGVALAVLVVARRGLRAGLALGIAETASALQVIAMKAVVHRPGPAVAFFHGAGSFPSGHTANAAVIATVAGLLVRRRWAWSAGAAYVLLVAMSRVVLAAHWATDTVAGAAEGAAVAVLVWAATSLVRSGARHA